jgi:hypothetical protein
MRGLLLIVVASLFVGCVSTDPGVGHVVLDSSRQIGELQEQNRQLTEQLNGYEAAFSGLRDAISSAEVNATQASDDIRGAIELLKQYKSAVDRLLSTSPVAPVPAPPIN